jgi:hypothetical protein
MSALSKGTNLADTVSYYDYLVAESDAAKRISPPRPRRRIPGAKVTKKSSSHNDQQVYLIRQVRFGEDCKMTPRYYFRAEARGIVLVYRISDVQEWYSSIGRARQANNLISRKTLSGPCTG